MGIKGATTTRSEVVRRGKSVSVICKRTKLPVIFSHGYSPPMVHTECQGDLCELD
jgi:hypothetical protein